MSKLTVQERDTLPGKAFALAGRRYPIEDPNHARNALSRVSQFGSPSQQATVDSAVHKKYPGMS